MINDKIIDGNRTFTYVASFIFIFLFIIFKVPLAISALNGSSKFNMVTLSSSMVFVICVLLLIIAIISSLSIKYLKLITTLFILTIVLLMSTIISLSSEIGTLICAHNSMRNGFYSSEGVSASAFGAQILFLLTIFYILFYILFFIFTIVFFFKTRRSRKKIKSEILGDVL